MSWPQWAGGLVSIPAVVGVMVALYYALRTRHAMDRVHFDPESSRVSWALFMWLNGGVFVATAVAWLVAAEFGATKLHQDMALIFPTFAVLIFSWCIKALPLRRWRRGYNQFVGRQPMVENPSHRDTIVTSPRGGSLSPSLHYTV
jgi:hypothetical protein